MLAEPYLVEGRLAQRNYDLIASRDGQKDLALQLMDEMARDGD